MIDNQKVKSCHTRRAAVVHIRQSDPSQVENNRESTARRYALVEKAVALPTCDDLSIFQPSIQPSCP